jgi:hypothetical protein
MIGGMSWSGSPSTAGVQVRRLRLERRRKSAAGAGEHLIAVVAVEHLADQLGEERGQVHVAGRVGSLGRAEEQRAADFVQRADVRVDAQDAGVEAAISDRALRHKASTTRHGAAEECAGFRTPNTICWIDADQRREVKIGLVGFGVGMSWIVDDGLWE